jgi:hypothetical protein
MLYALNPYRIASLIAMMAVFFAVQTARVSSTNGDPQLTLLTAQAILENGSIQLDEYKARVIDEHFTTGKWKYHEVNGHIYYNYPLGTPLLSIPFVAIANALGYDMAIENHDHFWQIQIAAILCVVMLLLLRKIALRFMDKWSALFWSTAFMFSTSFLSVNGTALWSFHFELIFLCLAVLEIIRVEQTEGGSVRPLYMGFLLFSAWFARPAALPFLVAVMLWLAWRRNLKAFVMVGLSSCALLVLFIAYSMLVHQRWLPLYYDPFTWNGAVSQHTMFFKLKALLFSPFRGLFVYTPILLASFVGLFIPEVRRSKLYGVMIGWFVLHVLMLTRHGNWWGGWSYGPRLFTDALPALIVMFFLTIHHAAKWSRPLAKKLMQGFLVVTLFFGAFVHTLQGLYNPETISWNDFPQADLVPDFYAWNWRYPAFFANAEMNNMKKTETFMWSQAHELTAQLPQGSALFCFDGEPRKHTILKALNRKKSDFNRAELFNNLSDLALSGRDTFYTTAAVRQTLEGNKQVRLIDDRLDSITLGAYLKKHEQYIVLLTYKPDAGDSLSDESLNYLKNVESSILDNNHNAPYVLILNKGVKYAERLDSGGGKAELKLQHAGKDIHLYSGGIAAGLIVKAEIDGKDVCKNIRGWNVIVLDDLGAVVNSIAFDTHREDRPFVELQRMHFVE